MILEEAVYVCVFIRVPLLFQQLPGYVFYASPLMDNHVHIKQPNQLGLTGRMRQVSIKTRIRVSKKNRKGIA